MKEFENNDMITYTSKKDLEKNFIAHWKNPEKYVAFKFNDETFPYASGFYVLRPYYQKLKICTGEIDDYAIEYSSYDKKWTLIRNPFYDPIVENLELTDNTIATLLEGEEFSHLHNHEEDILAFKTFEDVISKNKRAGKEIKKLKTEIEIKQEEIESLKKNYEDLMTKNDVLNNRLIRGKDMFKSLKKDCETMKEEKKLGFLKRAETLDENEDLRQELDKQKRKIQKQKTEIEELQSHNGKLSYDLTHTEEKEKKNEIKISELSYDLRNMKETEKEIEILKKDVDPLKNENKKLNHEIKRLKKEIKIFKSQNQDILIQQLDSLKGTLTSGAQMKIKEMSDSPPLQIKNINSMSTNEVRLSKISELKEEHNQDAMKLAEYQKNKVTLSASIDKVEDNIKFLEKQGREFSDAVTTFKNMTRRYEILITQVEQKTLSEDIERLEKMKNQNHSEEIKKLEKKVDLKRELFEFTTRYYDSEMEFLKNEIQLESELLKLFEMRKKNITETEKLDSAEAKGIEMKIDLYGRAGENHVKELKSCREIYTELQKNILNHEENYENINQLLVKE